MHHMCNCVHLYILTKIYVLRGEVPYNFPTIAYLLLWLYVEMLKRLEMQTINLHKRTLH